MHRTAFLATALLLTSTAVAAVPPRDPGGEEEWLQLDAELARMAATSRNSTEGLRQGVLVRTYYAYSGDDIATGGSEDLSGFELHDVEVWFETEVADFDVRVNLNLADGDAVVEDAYASWRLDENMKFTVGQFKPRVLFSSSIDAERQIFQNRSVLGAYFDDYSVGTQFWWRYDQWDFFGAITNGDNGNESDHFYVIRAEWALYDGPWDIQEGSYGAPQHLRVLLAGVYFHDDSGTDSDNQGGGADMLIQLGPSSFAAEFLDIGDGTGGPLTELENAVLSLDGSATPFAFTAGHFITSEIQAALRYQDTDDDDSTKVYSAALDWYPTEGVSWVLDVTNYDKSGPDGVVATVGLNVGRSK